MRRLGTRPSAGSETKTGAGRNIPPAARRDLPKCEALMELRRAGRTLLYTTHYMEEAQRLCDRVAIMNDGRVIAVGTPDELAAAAGLPAGNLEEVFLKLTGRSLRDE